MHGEARMICKPLPYLGMFVRAVVIRYHMNVHFSRNAPVDLLNDADTLLPRLQDGALGKFDLILHTGACSSTTERDAGFLIRNNYEFTRDLAAWTLGQKSRGKKRGSFMLLRRNLR